MVHEQAHGFIRSPRDRAIRIVDQLDTDRTQDLQAGPRCAVDPTEAVRLRVTTREGRLRSEVPTRSFSFRRDGLSRERAAQPGGHLVRVSFLPRLCSHATVLVKLEPAQT